MAAVVLSPDTASILQTFKEKLNKEWKQKAACGRTYVLTDTLTAWMMKLETPEPMTNAARLLRAVYANNHRQMFQEMSSNRISVGDNRCLLVFSMLLELGHGDLIDIFQKVGIVDKSLASSDYHYGQLRHEFVRYHIPNIGKIIDDVEKNKWSFCPAPIWPYAQKIFDGGRWVLPFCKRERINEKGGTADLWQVLVREEFVPPNLRATISGSKLRDKTFGWCYQMALKSYNALNSDLFEWERMAFVGIKGQMGMVQYLGEYSFDEKPNDPNSRTHNILLEFGELDLDEFFADLQQHPPLLSLEIIEFWGYLFKVADALQTIHNLEYKNEDGLVQRYHGWHADLKPDNILRVHGEFKLADFGFAKFKKRCPEKAPMEYIEGGTETYGAPECDPAKRELDSKTPVSQTIDTWSFGCVLSITATWVVLGFQGILQFERLRERAIAGLRSLHKNDEHVNTPKSDNAFHDGRVALPDVRNWHKYLRSVMRKSDTISGRVLDLVDERMLLEDPNSRLTSSDLCEKLQEILVFARAEHSQSLAAGRTEPIAKTVFEALLDVDKTAPSNAEEIAAVKAKTVEETQHMSQGTTNSHSGTEIGISLAVPQDRQKGKSKRIGKSQRLDNIPLGKVAHRAEVLETALNVRGEGIEPDQTRHSATKTDASTGSMPSHRDILVRTESEAEPAVLQGINFPLPSGPPEGSTRQLKEEKFLSPPIFETPDPSLDIVQVRQELERQRAKGLEARFASLFSKSRKDQYLRKFIKDRDIKFVVDNGTTMLPFWAVASYVLETLVMKLAGLDEDGLDLLFTIGEEHNTSNAKGSNAPSKFKKAIDKAHPDKLTPRGMRYKTDMAATFGEIFNEYLRDPKKKMTLIILTDGIWEGSVKSESVENKIADFLRLLKIRGTMEDRRFSIEFISFGNDEKAMLRLRRLDDELEKEFGIPDIIDTEPWTGNVNKMILGSLREDLDEHRSGSVPPATASSSSGR